MDSSQTLRNSSQISQKYHQYSEAFHHHHQHQLHAMKYPSYSSRSRTQSFSSSSSSSSSLSFYNLNHIDDNSPLSTPNSTPLRLSGKPFSWEYFPGIPKIKQLSKKKLQDHHHVHNQSPLSKNINKLLPLPPPTTNAIISVKNTNYSTTNPNNTKQQRKYFFESDPFFAALVECSKDNNRAHDDHDHDDEESSTSSASGENFRSIASAKVSRSFTDRFGLVSLYASCKRTCAVAESIRHLPRSTPSSYDLINTRSAR